MTYTVNDLASCIDKLRPEDQQFARSLIEQSKRRGLSYKQEVWVDKLTKRAKGEGPKPVNVGDLAATVALFDKARTHLKYPKVVLAIGAAGAVRLSMAGDRSKYPGTIVVTAPRADDGERTFYGRITREGLFVPSQLAGGLVGLTDALTRFAADPAKVAAEYGRLHGHCCFCGIALRDERSTAVGYGPICATNFGLPWGDLKHSFEAA